MTLHLHYCRHPGSLPIPASPPRARFAVRAWHYRSRAVPDIGQLRLAVCVDIVIRWLEASGYSVTYCRNVTDLDKGVRAAADAEGTPWWVLAERARRYYAQGCAALGVPCRQTLIPVRLARYPR